MFDYTRSDDRFEEVNIYYHISQFRAYLQTLGYTHTLHDPIPVHAHCQVDDNSFASSDFALGFGDGGVDDGEDGKVVIHEYAHLVFFQSISVQRGRETVEYEALKEALSDYWAISFFANQYLSPTLQACFAEWDALAYQGILRYANPRCYRRLDNTKRYPRDLVGSTYPDSEIYSGALWDLWHVLGRPTTDKLVLRSLREVEDNNRFGEATDDLVKADQIIYGGQHIFTIATTFKGRGIFDIYEWNGNPTHTTFLLPDGMTQTHSFYSTGDVDWVSFEANPSDSWWGRLYEIRATPVNSQVDPTLTLYDQDKTTILAYNHICATNNQISCLAWRPSTTGTFYLKIAPFNPDKNNTGITYTYQLHIQTRPTFIYLPIIQK